MILTQTHKRRSFVGSLNAGADLIESFRRLCVDNSILCGFFNGSGYLRDVRVRNFDAARKRHTEPTLHSGVFQVVSLTGNISLTGRETSIRCHAIGVSKAATDGEAGVSGYVAGEIVADDIVGFEFTLESVDDLRLYRDIDERSGLDGWLRLEFVQGGNPIVRQTPKDAGELAVEAAERRLPQAEKPAPAKPVSEKPAAKKKAAKVLDEEPVSNEETLQEIRVGDFLNHPTLGRCVVVSAEHEERLHIKLESGRVVELHTGLIDISPYRPGDNGERVFAVSIRRRR